MTYESRVVKGLGWFCSCVNAPECHCSRISLDLDDSGQPMYSAQKLARVWINQKPGLHGIAAWVLLSRRDVLPCAVMSSAACDCHHSEGQPTNIS